MVRLPSARTARNFAVFAALAAALSLTLQAQAPPTAFPNSPGAQVGVSLYGAVTDPNGDAINGASVVMESVSTRITQTVTSDEDGFFNFPALEPGRYTLTVTTPGFTRWTSSNILLPPDDDYDLPPITLQLAEATAQINVIATTFEMAEEQLHIEEQQRIFRVFPNFYVTYDWHSAPLTRGQKFRLALRASSDPGFFLQNAAVAGIEQWQNAFSGYGQGTVGYFKRFGAASADGFTAGMIGGAILPSLLHQDPRYFYKGTGSIRSRALYAISTVVICKGDNGKWQPNYSNVFGDLASAGLSNIYYPASNREGAGVTVDNALIGLAGSAFSALMQEFVLRKFTPHVKSFTPPSLPAPRR